VRYLVRLLLLANLGMLGWVLTQPEPQVLRYRPIPVPPGIEPLVLLSERGAETGMTAQHAPQKQSAAATAPKATAALAVDQKPTTATSVAATETTPADESAQATHVASMAEQQPVCETIGPLEAEADASAIRVLLTSQGFRSQVRTETVRDASGYWVFMPAMPAADARRIVAELDARGFTDYYVGKRNYISLGIFSRKEKAQRHLDHLRASGFEAKLDERYRTRKAYWLDVVEEDTPLPASGVWAKIHEQYPDINAQAASCE
jgi:hypothetical protein